MDVLVVGGGIVGLACARELARTGMKVELLERLPAGAEASLAAAGMLSPLSEITETLPGPLLDACRESRDLWLSWAPALAEETGLSVEHDASGALLVALDDRDEAWLDRVAAEALTVGEPVEEIDGGTLSRWVPDVSPGVRRSLLLAGEHRVDNVQACTVLALAAQKAGAVLTYGAEVERIERAGSGVRVVTRDQVMEAGLLVLAAGAWSGTIEGLPPLPVRPVRGQMLLLGGVDWPWKGTVRSQHGFACHNTAGGVESLLRFTRHALPGLDNARLETTWAGLRPGTPDGLPILGPIPGWPVIAATGHYRNGILLAPWTAREVARLAAGPAREETGPFSPERLLSLTR